MQEPVMVTFLILDSVDMVVLNSGKSIFVKVRLMCWLLNSTKIGCLTLNLKVEVVVDFLFPLVKGVSRKLLSR